MSPPRLPRLIIRSGGQTGVDRAALDAAVARGIPYSGWCPRGGWAEDCPDPPGVLARYPRLAETPSAAREQRTAWNVRDSHACLFLAASTGLRSSAGSRFALVCAELIFLKPWFLADVSAPNALQDVLSWLERATVAASADPLVMAIGGPRESESPGIYQAASQFLAAFLDAIRT